ncbi:unnamed protein product [Caretta caretta]
MVSVERLATLVGQWHVVVDLANAAFSLAIAPQSQDQFAFTWEDQPYAFTVMPESSKLSPTICHRLVSRDLEQLGVKGNVEMLGHQKFRVLTSFAQVF